MRFADYLDYTRRNLTRAQLRVILTVLAVVIGATLIVVMTSVGGGIQRNVLENVRASGGLNEILVSSTGRAPTAPGAGATPGGILDQPAIEAIETLPGVIAVLPEQLLLFFPAEVQADGHSARALLVGVPPDRLAAYGFTPVQGSAAPEPGQIVLGARVPESFFDQQGQRVPLEDPLGQTLNLVARRVQQTPSGPGGGLPGLSGPAAPQIQQRELPVTVAGILAPLGTQDDFTIWLNQNDVLDTQEWVTNRRPDLATDGYQALRVKTASTDLVRSVQDRITAMNLQATSPLSVLDEVNRGMLILQLLLGTIGLIALIVSGLGIANTMLMATFERTREIGILKAVGATEPQIVRLFLLEASLIGLVGALLGLAVGWLAVQLGNAVLLSMLASQPAAGLMPPAAVLATPGWVPAVVVVFAWLIAVGAGLYPALRAARLNIATALRAD
ncbi:MAG TPA: ABC transporter permease [Chloroflexota bacterium]|nr:ABC transporter permease [Chloroflexota bacterium]